MNSSCEEVKTRKLKIDLNMKNSSEWKTFGAVFLFHCWESLLKVTMIRGGSGSGEQVTAGGEVCHVPHCVNPRQRYSP